MEPVTHSGKRYTFVCVGCSLLAQASRKHAFICSGACRVRWHRAAHRQSVMKEYAERDVEAWAVAQQEALRRLRPDLMPRLESKRGRAHLKELAALQPEVSKAFDDLVMSVARSQQ
jgi:hypothetical protein